MKTWLTADPHFGHVNMTGEGRNLCGRPFDTVEEMNTVLVANINDLVGIKDRLIILGDICLGKLEQSLEVLGDIQAAEILLIPGNHDRWSAAYPHRGDAELKREEFRLRYEAVRPGITAIEDREYLSAWTGGSPWLFGPEHPLSAAWLSHYPYDGDSHGEDRYAALRPVNMGLPVIHGHVHDSWKIKGRQFNVGVDVNNFAPVSEDEVIAWATSLEKSEQNG